MSTTAETPTTDRDDVFSGRFDPFELFDAWFAEAAAQEPNDPNAMTLATVDATGLPNARIVLLKEITPAGLVFYTNTESAKGDELAANPAAALLFHWKSLRRQVRFRGPVTPVSAEEADAYFRTRPRGSRIGAWASQQSRPLDSRATLEKAVEDLSARHGEDDIPRPPHWSGYRLVPSSIEFWQDGAFRLHDRIRYARPRADAAWQAERLYP